MRILASEALTNCVSSASSTVFWFSFSISVSNGTVFPSARPEIGRRIHGQLRLQAAMISPDFGWPRPGATALQKTGPHPGACNWAFRCWPGCWRWPPGAAATRPASFWPPRNPNSEQRFYHRYNVSTPLAAMCQPGKNRPNQWITRRAPVPNWKLLPARLAQDGKNVPKCFQDFSHAPAQDSPSLAPLFSRYPLRKFKFCRGKTDNSSDFTW